MGQAMGSPRGNQHGIGAGRDRWALAADLAHIIMVCFGNRAIHPHYAVQDHQRHASGRSAITAFSPIRNAASKKVCHLTWSVWQMAY